MKKVIPNSIENKIPNNIKLMGFLNETDYWNLLRSVDGIIVLTLRENCLVPQGGICQNNSISTIDVSNNTLLLELGVTFNNLTELDVSTTTQLGQLYCHLNALTQLNLKNGHNDVLNTLNSTNNSLTCIQVDNKTEAEGKGGWQKDSGASYEETCPGLNLDDFALSSISIYPNPSKYRFYIELQTEANYILSNVFGQEVKKGFLTSGNN